MTEIELKQMCAGMSRQELLNLLTSVEKNYNIVYPYIKKHTSLSVKLKEEEKAYDLHKGNAKGSTITSAICLVLALVFFIWRSTARSFGALILTFLTIGAVATSLPSLYAMLNSRKAAKKCEKELPGLKAEVTAAQEQMDQMAQQYKTDMLIRYWICPEQSWEPRYLRIFVSYFESGRADSLKEAYALFDEMIHREKMEGLAHEQVKHAQAAEIAAHAAVTAANRAASDASSAKSAADWAAYNTRFKN